MDSITATFFTFASCVVGYGAGQWVSRFLPQHHYQHSDARDVLKSATGMIATLVALVLGLLVTSSKSTFDRTTDAMNESGAKIIQIDRLLKKFGPEALAAKNALKILTTDVITQMDEGKLSMGERLEANDRHPEGPLEDRFTKPIQNLVPTNGEQEKIQRRASELMTSLIESRWSMIERATNKLPNPFLVLLFFWLAVLFAGFGILAPRNNPTILTAFLICGFSMAGAIYLIVEMNEPLDGTMRVSTSPLKIALKVMSH